MGYPERIELSINGVWREAPSINVDGTSVVATGAFLRVARVHDEEWLDQTIQDPSPYVQALRQHAGALPADIFTFAQRVPDRTPRHDYTYEWDSIATARFRTFDEWWERLPQETRKNARRAVKRGLVSSIRPLDDDLVAGIVELNNETPMRQGRRFPHYGKSFEQVKQDHSPFAERSEFICGHIGTELVGFAKVVYCAEFATILQLMTKAGSSDARPANALLVKSVQRCQERGLECLIYGKYRYGRQSTTSLMEFKARNGFEEVLVPRYFVPLTAKGGALVRCRLHLGASELVPAFALDFARTMRGARHRARMPRSRHTPA